MIEYVIVHQRPKLLVTGKRFSSDSCTYMSFAKSVFHRPCNFNNLSGTGSLPKPLTNGVIPPERGPNYDASYPNASYPNALSVSLNI